MAEGGEHAIFEETMSSSRSPHQLLRIKIKDLAISDQIVSFLETEGVDDDMREANGAKSNSYISKIIAPLLAPYVDVPVIIQLDWSFLKMIKRQAIQRGCIPNARRSNWYLQSIPQRNDICSSNFVKHVYVQLLPDYRSLPVTPSDSCYALVPSTALSVELKPKAGYIAFSPLVQPKNRIKYQHSRYVLKQRLYQLEDQEIRSGWSSGQVQQSTFDPVDLYSGNAERIQKAVRELFRCPQNNLRVTFNSQLLLSKGKDGSPAYSDNAELLCKEILSNWIPGDGVNFRSAVEENICAWLVTVFQKEDVFQRLKRLQKLDIVDADGAILLYSRLVDLCEGSHEEAQSLLDNVVTCTENDGTSPLESSPFSWPLGSDDDLLRRLCREVKSFERILLETTPELPSEDILDRHHEEMMKMISALNVSECQHLLWNWLLSLTLNDVSMFVTFQQMTVPSDNFDQIQDSSQMTSCADHGVLKLPLEGKAHVYLAYTIRIVDCDGKPAKKLRTRWKKEESFALL